MEQFFENILKYSLNLAVDNIHDEIQLELSEKDSVVGSIVSAALKKGYEAIKLEMNQP